MSQPNTNRPLRLETLRLVTQLYHAEVLSPEVVTSGVREPRTLKVTLEVDDGSDYPPFAGRLKVVFLTLEGERTGYSYYAASLLAGSSGLLLDGGTNEGIDFEQMRVLRTWIAGALCGMEVAP